MKTFTDSNLMPFGKYGPGNGDHRMLRDVPLDYLRAISAEDWMYPHRELCEYIEARLDREKAKLQARPPFKKAAPPKPPEPMNKDWKAQLEALKKSL